MKRMKMEKARSSLLHEDPSNFSDRQAVLMDQRKLESDSKDLKERAVSRVDSVTGLMFSTVALTGVLLPPIYPSGFSEHYRSVRYSIVLVFMALGQKVLPFRHLIQWM